MQLNFKDLGRRLAPVLIIIAGILWGLTGIFVRQLNAIGLHTMNVVAVRVICTAILLSLYALFFKPSLFKIKLKDLWCFLGTGIASIIFFNYCYFKTMTLASLSVAAILLYTAPAIVMIFSLLLFREQMSIKKILALFAAIIGCISVSLWGQGKSCNNISLQALITGLGAGFGYALYTIFGRYGFLKGYSSMQITLWTFIFAAVGILPFIDFNKITEVITFSFGNSVFVILFSVICTLLPYLLYTFALSYTESSVAAVLASVEPVAAAFVGIIVFGEPFSLGNVIGIIAILISIILLK